MQDRRLPLAPERGIAARRIATNRRQVRLWRLSGNPKCGWGNGRPSCWLACGLWKAESAISDTTIGWRHMYIGLSEVSALSGGVGAKSRVGFLGGRFSGL